VSSGDPVVAIDGPSGSGKSTVARGVAAALGVRVLDTGAMYRAVALAVLEAGVDPSDADACTAAARAIRVDVADGATFVDGREVTALIRAPEVTAVVSAVAAHPGVRDVLVARQREWVAVHGGGVVEGRDIGSVVFPAATVKVYLVASEEERARRRQRDELAAARAVDVDAVRDELARRDAFDQTRVASPLRPAEDAVVVDTTHRAVDDVVAEIVARVREAQGTSA
jgi:cytidylate kinase